MNHRTREEIEKSVNRIIDSATEGSHLSAATLAGLLETTLDIRDLLTQLVNKKP